MTQRILNAGRRYNTDASGQIGPGLAIAPSLEYMNQNLLPLKPKVKGGPFPGRGGSVVVDNQAYKVAPLLSPGYAQSSSNSPNRNNQGSAGLLPGTVDGQDGYGGQGGVFKPPIVTQRDNTQTGILFDLDSVNNYQNGQ